MTVSAFATGTQTATLTTEHFVSDVNAVGTYTFHVDTINMVAGDDLILRVYSMVLTGGTTRVTYSQRYSGTQLPDYIKVSVPISTELTDSQALRFSLQQNFGTGRAYPWKVLKYA